MTLVFTTSGSVTNIGFEAIVQCVDCQDPIGIPAVYCEDAQSFCTEVDGGFTFPAATGTTSEFGGGICCLGSTPNPAWYYMRIEEPGPIDLLISSSFDVDFICWGPFTEFQWQNGICGEVTDPNQDCGVTAPSFYLDCSFSGSATETCNIPNAQEGEFYLMLITNFSNQVTNINVIQSNNSGSMNCQLTCDLEVNLDVSNCDPLSNTFTVTGQVTFNTPPTTGLVSIVNSLGGNLEFSAPFGSTIDFEFVDLASNGAVGEIEIDFVDTNGCYFYKYYTAPEPCSICQVVASNSSPFATGQSVFLSATSVPNATYVWTGPNGFYSTLQNPVLTNAGQSMQGIYTVTAFVDLNDCQSTATTNVVLDSTLGAGNQAVELDINNAFSFWPNPVSDQLFVSFNSPEKVINIQIFDMNGRLILPRWSEVSNTNCLIIIHDLPQGLYQVAIQTSKGVYCNRFTKIS